MILPHHTPVLLLWTSPMRSMHVTWMNILCQKSHRVVKRSCLASMRVHTTDYWLLGDGWLRLEYMHTKQLQPFKKFNNSCLSMTHSSQNLILWLLCQSLALWRPPPRRKVVVSANNLKMSPYPPPSLWLQRRRRNPPPKLLSLILMMTRKLLSLLLSQSQHTSILRLLNSSVTDDCPNSHPLQLLMNHQCQ